MSFPTPSILTTPPVPGFNDIVLQIDGAIATIMFNRPASLNAFGGKLLIEFQHALRHIEGIPEVVFTVLYGAGRFFSSGADVVAFGDREAIPDTEIERKIVYNRTYMAWYAELLRMIIDHPKLFTLALNGPMVGGGCAWFLGVADLVLASETAYAQVPFSALGLVPEQGSGIMLPESMGYRRAVEFLILGRKLTVEEMERFGLVNRIYPQATFHADVRAYLQDRLAVNEHSSMLVSKKLMAGPLRDKRVHAVNESMSALSSRFSTGVATKRLEQRRAEMVAAKKKAKI
ncbi:peroxisomal d3,d2-enoyl-CoA isomerase [Hyaloraphidium curvatum]|nr:peroxisomal d3,d2-enoyl-CoA isomerase [Hyaloraphidium curvatum]